MEYVTVLPNSTIIEFDPERDLPDYIDSPIINTIKRENLYNYIINNNNNNTNTNTNTNTNNNTNNNNNNTNNNTNNNNTNTNTNKIFF